MFVDWADLTASSHARLSQWHMLPHGLEPWTSRLLAERSNQLSYESNCGRMIPQGIIQHETMAPSPSHATCMPSGELGPGHAIPFTALSSVCGHHRHDRYSKFARVVKGVDLRSTAGNCAWVRTPQLAALESSSFAWMGCLCSIAVQKKHCRTTFHTQRLRTQGPRLQGPRTQRPHTQESRGQGCVRRGRAHRDRACRGRMHRGRMRGDRMHRGPVRRDRAHSGHTHRGHVHRGLGASCAGAARAGATRTGTTYTGIVRTAMARVEAPSAGTACAEDRARYAEDGARRGRHAQRAVCPEGGACRGRCAQRAAPTEAGTHRDRHAQRPAPAEAGARRGRHASRAAPTEADARRGRHV